MTHLKHTVIPNVCFFELLCPTDMAFSARVISLSTNMATDLALSRVISRAAINIDFKPDGFS